MVLEQSPESTDQDVDDPVHIDPHGEFATVRYRSNHQNVGNDSVVWKLVNEGIDLRLVAISVSISQGAEDGRAFATVGRKNIDVGGVPRGVLDRLWEKVGPGGNVGSGRMRGSVMVPWPGESPPLFPTNDTVFVLHDGDSATSDEIKLSSTLYLEPHDDAVIQ